VVEIRPLFIKFLNFNVIDVFFFLSKGTYTSIIIAYNFFEFSSITSATSVYKYVIMH
jgi:hypothetical protein